MFQHSDRLRANTPGAVDHVNMCLRASNHMSERLWRCMIRCFITWTPLLYSDCHRQWCRPEGNDRRQMIHATTEIQANESTGGNNIPSSNFQNLNSTLNKLSNSQRNSQQTFKLSTKLSTNFQTLNKTLNKKLPTAFIGHFPVLLVIFRKMTNKT